jgi:hypothetical protein
VRDSSGLSEKGVSVSWLYEFIRLYRTVIADKWFELMLDSKGSMLMTGITFLH